MKRGRKKKIQSKEAIMMANGKAAQDMSQMMSQAKTPVMKPMGKRHGRYEG